MVLERGKYMYNSHWIYKNEKLVTPPENAFGFVYEITNKITNRVYIGRKYLGTTRKVKVKGSTRRKIIRGESNWAVYTGSCIPLNEDIKKYGKDKFKFEILIFGETKGQTNMAEETIQHCRKVLFNDSYYNDSIGSRKFMSVKLTEEFKKRLLEL